MDKSVESTNVLLQSYFQRFVDNAPEPSERFAHLLLGGKEVSVAGACHGFVSQRTVVISVFDQLLSACDDQLLSTGKRSRSDDEVFSLMLILLAKYEEWDKRERLEMYLFIADMLLARTGFELPLFRYTEVHITICCDELEEYLRGPPNPDRLQSLSEDMNFYVDASILAECAEVYPEEMLLVSNCYRAAIAHQQEEFEKADPGYWLYPRLMLAQIGDSAYADLKF